MSHVKEIKVSDTAPRRIGVVTSDKRSKTRSVSINYLIKHPKYGKYTKKRSVIHAHDENNQSKLGDRVEIAECRPISKTKSWVLTRIVDAAPDQMASHQTTVITDEGEIGAEVEDRDRPEDEDEGEGER